MAGLVQHLPNHRVTSLQNVRQVKPDANLIGHPRPVPGATKARRSGSLVCHAASSGMSATPPVPEGDVDIPLLTGLANTIEWLSDYPEFYQKRFKKFGGLFKTNLLFNPMVVVTDENEVRRLLQAEHKLVESAWPQSMHNLLGPNAILTAPAKAHKKQRQILSQAFTDAAMRLYLPTVLDVCRYTLAQWSASEEPVLFYSAARAFAFDVAATVLTGTRFDGNTLVRMREDFDVYADGLFTVPLEIPGTPYAKAVKARKNILAEIERLILDAKASNEAQSRGRKNALRLLLDAEDENGEKLTMEQLKDQILTQLFAGHETTGATLARVLPEIQKQPHILAKMRQEQAELIQEFGDDITYDVLERMPYTDAVLREVMRLHGIVDGVWRQALEDLEVQGRRVPKGWTVQLMVKQAGLDMPEFAADADRFRPERWLEDSGAPVKKEPKGFMPFGEGPRKCLGMLLAKMEMRALLAVLAREYTVELEDPDESWFQGFKPVNKLPGRVYKYQA
ncbi:g2100 [Coccomyxa elongata]